MAFKLTMRSAIAGNVRYLISDGWGCLGKRKNPSAKWDEGL